MKFYKTKITLGLLLVACFYSTTIFSQQDAHYTQYTYNMGVLNPAYIGTNEVTTANLLVRSQWVGIEGSPQTATFSISSPMGKNVGLGLSVIHDEIGPVTENNLYLDFSYTLNLSDSKKLAFGLKGGYTFLDVGFLTGNEINDPLNIPVNLKEPNFGAGIFYFTDKFYLGAAIPNIIKTRHLDTADNIVSTSTDVSHIFLNTGYVFDLSNNLKFKPSAMVKAAIGAPLSIDISGNFLVRNNLELGASYRYGDSVSAIIGFNLSSDFRVGYAYDSTLTPLRNYNSGSHEIMLSYKFNRLKIKSPRFF